MTLFSVGDQVVIRFGKQQGQKATVIKNPNTDVYKVKVEDGSIRYYSGKGLEKEQERVQNLFEPMAGSSVQVSKDRE